MPPCCKWTTLAIRDPRVGRPLCADDHGAHGWGTPAPDARFSRRPPIAPDLKGQPFVPPQVGLSDDESSGMTLMRTMSLLVRRPVPASPRARRVFPNSSATAGGL